MSSLPEDAFRPEAPTPHPRTPLSKEATAFSVREAVAQATRRPTDSELTEHALRTVLYLFETGADFNERSPRWLQTLEKAASGVVPSLLAQLHPGYLPVDYAVLIEKARQIRASADTTRSREN